jgi:type I restriction enzyme S subunit
MSLDVLFAHATNLIHTPADVAKLRQLILTLAVQGKLVPQDAADEPVNIESTLIETSNLFELPYGWEWINIADLHPQFQNGASSRGDVNGKKIIVLRLADITNKRISLQNARILPIEQNDIDKYRIQNGDILITRVNGSADIVGNFNLVDSSVDAIYCDHFIRMRCSNLLILPQYITLIGGTTLVRNQIKNLFISTAGQKTVNQTHISSITIPLPPLAEQRRIVAKVDALMARCDELEALLTERARQQEQVAQAAVARVLAAPSVAALEMLFDPQIGVSPAALRQTILALAVQGKLVPQDASWQIVPLKQLTTKIGSGSTPQGGKEIYQDTGIPLIRSMNVYTSKFIYTGLVYISDEQAEKLRSVTVHVNDVLLNITGASIGRVTVVPENLVGARVNQHVCIIRPINELLPKYLEIVLASPQFQFIIFDVQVGATREALTKSMIESFEIPLPPLAEQRRIVTKVDALMALVDRLEAQQAQAQRTASALLDAVVAGEG